jgi:hypothetical protein
MYSLQYVSSHFPQLHLTDKFPAAAGLADLAHGILTGNQTFDRPVEEYTLGEASSRPYRGCRCTLCVDDSGIVSPSAWPIRHRLTLCVADAGRRSSSL